MKAITLPCQNPLLGSSGFKAMMTECLWGLAGPVGTNQSVLSLPSPHPFNLLFSGCSLPPTPQPPHTLLKTLYLPQDTSHQASPPVSGSPNKTTYHSKRNDFDLYLPPSLRALKKERFLKTVQGVCLWTVPTSRNGRGGRGV